MSGRKSRPGTVPKTRPTVPRAARRERGPATEPQADVPRERRLGKVAGLAAIGSLVCSIASVPVAASGTGTGRIAAPSDNATADRSLLLDVAGIGSGQTAAMILRCVGLLLLVVVVLYLYDIIKARKPDTPGYVPVLGIAGVLLLAVNTVIGFNETKSVADVFVSSGPRTPERATQLLDDSAILRGTGASLARLTVNAMFGAWLALTCLDAMRVGLLTRFLAYFGFAAGVASALSFPAGDAITFGWLGSVGILALGYWPGGRPPAWDAGRAVPLEEEAQRPARSRENGRTT